MEENASVAVENAPATEPAGGIPAEPAPATAPVDVGNTPQSAPEPLQGTNAPAQVQSTQPTENNAPTAPQPITYQPFSIPEGFDVPADSFKEIASQSGLSQSQAQAMIDYYCKEVIPANREAVKQQISSWKQETINQMGRQGLDMANSLVQKLSKTNPLFAPLLRDTGLCYHPVVVKALVDLASHMSEGTVAPLSTFQSPQSQRDLASVMFPNSLK